MQFQLTAAPAIDGARQQEELGRLLRFAKRLSITFAHVCEPFRRTPQTVCLVDVPDQFAEQAERVLAIAAQRDDAVTVTKTQLKPRHEWTQVKQVQANAGAQPLDGSVLSGVASASLCVQYTSRGVTATLRYSERDGYLLDRVQALGWEPRHSGLAGLLPRASAQVAPQLGWPESTIAVSGAPLLEVLAPSNPSSLPSSPILAAPGAPGLLLGTAMDGSAVQLSWESHVISLVAPPDRTRAALLAFTGRALQGGLALIIIASREVLRDEALMPFQTRVRTLDGMDLWQSAAIPWRETDPEMLTQALSLAGLKCVVPEPLPEFFGDLLAKVGGEDLATEAVLGLTAPPGDDLCGILMAGGGVALVDDGDAGSKLLTDLLLASLAVESNRPILLLRNPNTMVPAALAARSIQVVLGAESAVAATMTSIAPAEGWRLTFADGSAPIDILADLNATPLNADSDFHSRIIGALSGGSEPVIDEGLDAWYEETQTAEPARETVVLNVTGLVVGEERDEAALDRVPIDDQLGGEEELEIFDDEDDEGLGDAEEIESADDEEEVFGLGFAEEDGEGEAEAPLTDNVAEPEAAFEPVTTFDVDLLASDSARRTLPRLHNGARRRGFVMRRAGGAAGDARQDDKDVAAPAEAPPTADEIAALFAPNSEAAPASPDRVDDASLVADFHAGTSMADLIRRLQTADPATSRDTHRARLRALMSSSTPTLVAPQPIDHASAAAKIVMFDPMSKPDVLKASDFPITVPADETDDQLLTEAGALREAGEDEPVSLVIDYASLADEAGQPEGAIVAEETDEDRVWADWQSGARTGDIVAWLQAQRSISAAKAREEIYEIVVPRIVEELNAAELVARLCGGKKLLKAQTQLHEDLLRRVARQERSVAGANREKVQTQIITIMTPRGE